MSEATRALARRWFDEVINARRPEAVDEIFAPEYAHHGGHGVLGREDVKQFAAELLAAYPDRRGTVHELIAEGDLVAVHWSSTGRRQGTFRGQPATGTQETATGMWILRVQGDRVAEGWEVVDFGIHE